MLANGRLTQIIFPLREKLFSSALFLQQRPKSNGGRRVITLPTLPWDDADRPPSINFGRVDKPPIFAANVWVGYGLCATGQVARPLNAFKQPPYLSSFSEQRFEPAVVHALKPLPATFYSLRGITYTGTGVVLANCDVYCFSMNSDRKEMVTSNGDGLFYCKSPVYGQISMLYAYKSGSPNKAGTTLNNIAIDSSTNIYLRDPTVPDAGGGGGTRVYGLIS